MNELNNSEAARHDSLCDICVKRDDCNLVSSLRICKTKLECCDDFEQRRDNFTDITASKETLARFLSDLTFGRGCDECPADTGDCDVNTCVYTWLQWLER